MSPSFPKQGQKRGCFYYRLSLSPCLQKTDRRKIQTILAILCSHAQQRKRTVSWGKSDLDVVTDKWAHVLMLLNKKLIF
jgi:hypothetical protein